MTFQKQTQFYTEKTFYLENARFCCVLDPTSTLETRHILVNSLVFSGTNPKNFKLNIEAKKSQKLSKNTAKVIL